MMKKISWHGSALRVTSLSDDYPDVNGVFSSQRGAIITELWGPSQAKSNLSYIHNYMNIAYAWEAETLLGLFILLFDSYTMIRDNIHERIPLVSKKK